MNLGRVVRCVIAGALLVASAEAQTPDNLGKLQRKFEDLFRGRQLLLHVPYASKSLRFDQDGQCMSGCDRGGWAADGTLQVEHFRLHNDEIQISGRRLTVYYDSKNERIWIPTDKFDLWVALTSGVNEESVNQVLAAVFRRAGELVPNGPPPQSQPIDLECKKDPSAGPGSDQQVCRSKGSEDPWVERSKLQVPVTIGVDSDGQKIYVVSKATKPPRATFTPDPEYSERDRKKRLQGETRFAVLVDSHGRVQSLRELSADSPGFAVDSAAALAQWIFDPATINGNPVSVLIDVQTNFRLY